MKKHNLVLINNATYQRETLSERPIRQPLSLLFPTYVVCVKTQQKHTSIKYHDKTIWTIV